MHRSNHKGARFPPTHPQLFLCQMHPMILIIDDYGAEDKPEREGWLDRMLM